MSRTGEEFFSSDFRSSTYQWLAVTWFGDKVIGRALDFATRWDVVVAAALMALVSFSLPGRESPNGSEGLDFISLSKLAIRLAVIAWFGSIALLHCHASLTMRSIQLDRPIADIVGKFIWHSRWSDQLLLPWWCFAAWSLVTVTWSPLFSVSLGQWLGLIALLAFAQVISNRYAAAQYFQWQVLAKQLSVVLTFYSLMALIAHMIAPGASGLDRSITLEGNKGLFHPTAVGATSSLGLTLAGVLYLHRVMTNVPTTLAMMALHFVVLYFSASRSALAMALVVGLICFIFLMPRFMRASIFLLGGSGLLLMVISDPGFELAKSGIRDTSAYVQRGQSAEQLRQISGRAELWQAVWEQFKTSPVIGHGYFVTSANGKLDVWEGPSNQDAHNVGLQVLVSTGIVGSFIFAYAVLVSFGHLAHCFLLMMKIRVSRLAQPTSSTVAFSFARKPAQPKTEGDFISFVIIVVIWFLGWTQGCVSFLGPIRPEAVTFFGLLGLVSAHARCVGTGPTAWEYERP